MRNSYKSNEKKIIFSAVLPKVLNPVTTVTDFFFPLGALDTVTNLGISSFFFVFSIPLPPRFCRFFSSSPPPPPPPPASVLPSSADYLYK